jgi:urease accessory protein
MGGAAAAVRLLPIDMADAAAVVAQLAPLADQIADRVTHQTSPSLKIGPPNGDKRSKSNDLERWLAEEWPAWSAPALELGAEAHARWEVRLFAS